MLVSKSPALSKLMFVSKIIPAFTESLLKSQLQNLRILIIIDEVDYMFLRQAILKIPDTSWLVTWFSIFLPQISFSI